MILIILTLMVIMILMNILVDTDRYIFFVLTLEFLKKMTLVIQSSTKRQI